MHVYSEYTNVGDDDNEKMVLFKEQLDEISRWETNKSLANLYNVYCTEFIPLFSNICVCYNLFHKTKPKVHASRLGNCTTFQNL